MTGKKQPGAAYAALPEPDATTVGLGAVWNRHSMRDFADATCALRASHGQAPQQSGVGNSGFDHKTAADFLNGKTVSDEAVRKFVAASRWAHDDRASLQATLQSARNELASREAEIALLKTALMNAEEAAPTTQPAPQQEAQEPVKLSDEQIKAHGDKASRMMARDLTRFDAACEVNKYLREQGAPYYYMHRMCIVLFGNDEGTEAARAPDTDPQPSPAAQGDALDAAVSTRWLTVVYRDVAAGDEAREILEHPKTSAMSWSHAMHERDAARKQGANHD